MNLRGLLLSEAWESGREIGVEGEGEWGAGGRLGERTKGSETARRQGVASCLFLESKSPKWLPGEHLVEQSNETRLKSDQEMGFPLQAKPRVQRDPKSSSDLVQSPALGKGFCRRGRVQAMPSRLGPWLGLWGIC